MSAITALQFDFVNNRLIKFRPYEQLFEFFRWWFISYIFDPKQFDHMSSSPFKFKLDGRLCEFRLYEPSRRACREEFPPIHAMSWFVMFDSCDKSLECKFLWIVYTRQTFRNQNYPMKTYPISLLYTYTKKLATRSWIRRYWLMLCCEQTVWWTPFPRKKGFN